MAARDAHRMRVIARLKDLEHDERLTPDEVIADAKDPTSPLHDEFEWDVNEAALEHWRATARQLIRSVRYTVEIASTQIDVSRYVHDPDRGHEQGYVSVSRVLTEKDLAARCLAEELSRAESAATRALSYAAVFQLEKAVTQLIHRIEAVSEKLKRATTK